MDTTNAVQLAAPLTAAEEGFSASPYLDAGSYAIGYGNHFYSDGSPVSADDDPITESDAYGLLLGTLSAVAGEVAAALTVPVSDNLLAGLTDLTYNWGIGNFKKSVLLGMINGGQDSQALSDQWAKTATTSQDVPSNDLIARRQAEISLAFQTPESLPVLAIALIVGLIVLAAVTMRR